MKTIIRESIAMIILICAIMLILVTLFFDYIKENSIEISSATYQMSKEEQNILKEKQKYLASQNTITLSSGYTVTEDDLNAYKSSGDLKQGQSNPFDETPITEVTYDENSATYYVKTDPRKSSNSTQTTTNSKPKKEESTYFQNDVSAPSAEAGSIISENKKQTTK
ncbi:MAG: hypothetical protein HFJ44_01955 [Clostridia bacterium]|jgi:hypothetical protein|nr:hypothetical protein [Clostridia bacterium]